MTLALISRPSSSQAEEHVDYRFEDYNEDHHRVHVQTHSALAEGQVLSWLKLKGEYVYDAISGATPDGRPAPAQIKSYDGSLVLPTTLSHEVPLSTFDDVRQSYNVEATTHWDRHTLTPQISYSGESDYISRGAALNYALELNEKNTTLSTGLSYTWDHIIPRHSPYLNDVSQKRTWDFLLGITQLLSKKTVFTANFVLGTSAGYLNDPYKGVVFANYPQFSTNLIGGLVSEQRPHHRVKEMTYLSLTHFVTPLNGSAEGSYRFSHDSYGIFSHTFSLAWLQKIGHCLVISPAFRYYRQTAADFYTLQPGGDFFDSSTWAKYFSADHRLSSLETFTYGLTITAIVKKQFYLDLAYKRYVMAGTDGQTSASAYPSANVFAGGARFAF